MKGRPTVYTQELADRICEWLAEGKSLRAFVDQNNDSPARSTICLWIVNNDAFSDQYARARQAGGHSHADDILQTAEEVRQGTLDPNAARVVIDAKKWAAERMAPRHHMPQSLVNHQSPDGSMTPKPTEITIRAADDRSDD